MFPISLETFSARPTGTHAVDPIEHVSAFPINSASTLLFGNMLHSE